MSVKNPMHIPSHARVNSIADLLGGSDARFGASICVYQLRGLAHRV
jgi:hypothetical protein